RQVKWFPSVRGHHREGVLIFALASLGIPAEEAIVPSLIFGLGIVLAAASVCFVEADWAARPLLRQILRATATAVVGGQGEKSDRHLQDDFTPGSLVRVFRRFRIGCQSESSTRASKSSEFR